MPRECPRRTASASTNQVSRRAIGLNLYLRPVVCCASGRDDEVKTFARDPWAPLEIPLSKRASASCAFILTLLLLEVGCAGTGTKQNPPPPPPQLSITISPTSANVRAGASQAFTAQLTNATNQNVTWEVNGISGGNSTIGTISSTGSYVAPAMLPNPNTVNVGVASVQDSSIKTSSAVTLWNVTPNLTSVTPTSFNTGSFTLT